MRALEWAIESQKTIGGKIVSVALAVTLIFSFSNLFYGGDAFAEEKADATTEVPAETDAAEPVATEAASAKVTTATTSEEDAVKKSEEAQENKSVAQPAKETQKAAITETEQSTNQDVATSDETLIQPMAGTDSLEFSGQNESLSAALSHENITKLTFTADYSSNDAITLTRDVVIDLNGHNVSIDRLTARGCKLEIVDSVGSGSLNETGSDTLLTAINGGFLVIDGGKIVSNNPTTACIQINSSELIINGGIIESSKNSIVAYQSNVLVRDGLITASSTSGKTGITASRSSNLTVTGGQISGYYGVVLGANSNASVTGGAISGYIGFYSSESEAKIEGNGTISGELIGIRATNYSTVDVTGSTIKGQRLSAILGEKGSTVNYGGTANIVESHNGISLTIPMDPKKPDTIGSTLNVTGGSIQANNVGISGNGSDYLGPVKINISGGDIKGLIGVYHPQVEGVMNITDGFITGEWSGVEVRAGYVTISGGTIVSNSNEFSAGANDSGSTVKGAGVAVSQHVTSVKTELTITGGDITGCHAVYENVFRNPGDNPAEIERIALNITGGKFTGTHGDVVFSEHQNVFITGGYFNQDLDSSDTMKQYLGNYDDNGTEVQYPSHKTNFYEGYFHVHQPVMTAEGEYATNDTQHWQGCTVDNCIEAERVNHTTDDGDIIKQPVCLEDGEQELICSTCGKKHAATKSLPAIGHAYGEWTTVTEATENSEGLQQRVCAHDATHVETRTIPALPATTDPGTTDPAPVPGGGGTTTPAAPAGVGPTIPATAPAAAPAAAAEGTVIADEENPLAAPEETIVENENPLAAFDTPQCWVHYLMIIGMIVTVIYGAVVVGRRLGYTRKIDKIDKDMTGIEGTPENATHPHGVAHHA